MHSAAIESDKTGMTVSLADAEPETTSAIRQNLASICLGGRPVAPPAITTAEADPDRLLSITLRASMRRLLWRA
jgi:hypothetical protein